MIVILARDRYAHCDPHASFRGLLSAANTELLASSPCAIVTAQVKKASKSDEQFTCRLRFMNLRLTATINRGCCTGNRRGAVTRADRLPSVRTCKRPAVGAGGGQPHRCCRTTGPRGLDWHSVWGSLGRHRALHFVDISRIIKALQCRV